MVPVRNLASELATAWQARLDHTQEALREGAPRHRVGYYRVAVKILTFLLQRYGDDPGLDRRRPAAFLSRTIEEPLERGKPPRSRRDIRRLLEQIAEGNR